MVAPRGNESRFPIGEWLSICGAVVGRWWLITLGWLGFAALVWAFYTLHHPEVEHLWQIRLALLLVMVPGMVRIIVSAVLSPWQILALKAKDRRYRATRAVEPLVSVIVPAWNEEVGIAQTVRSLLASSYTNLEVVVVNDGSSDGTERVVRAIADARSDDRWPRLRYVWQENGGKSRAMNHGVTIARGDIVMTVDADSVVDRRAVEMVARRFRDPDVMCVCGNVKIGNHASFLGLVQKLEYLMGFFHKKADSLLDAIYIVGGAAAAYRREVFERVGMFARDIITEDIEMSTRIQDHGMLIEYEPRAIVYTEGPSELPGLMKQRLRWKHGRLITFWRFRHLFFSLRRRHHKFLTWLVLPVAVLGDTVLLFQWAILTFTVGYGVVTHDYLPLLVYVCLLASLVVLQVLTDNKLRENAHLLWMAPAAWLNVAIVDLVELQAIVGSLRRLASRRELTWQRWQRSGVFGSRPPELPGA